MPSTVSTMRPIGPQVSIAGSSTRRHAPFLRVVHQVENVPRVAPKTVELVNHQRIARPNELEDGSQLVAALTALSACLLDADDRAARGLERSRLDGRVLIIGADAGVADQVVGAAALVSWRACSWFCSL